MDRLSWFSIQVYYTVTSGLDEQEEMSYVEKLTNHLEDGYETDTGYFNLIADPILQMVPHAFFPKDKTNKKYFTTITFESGYTTNAVGRPQVIYEKINEYMADLPDEIPNVVV